MDSDEFIPAGWTDEQINKIKEDYEEDRIHNRYGHGSDVPWDNLTADEKELIISEYYWSICKDESEWPDKRELETFYEEYTSPSGDEIVVFGRYG